MDIEVTEVGLSIPTVIIVYIIIFILAIIQVKDWK